MFDFKKKVIYPALLPMLAKFEDIMAREMDRPSRIEALASLSEDIRRRSEVIAEPEFNKTAWSAGATLLGLIAAGASFGISLPTVIVGLTVALLMGPVAIKTLFNGGETQSLGTTLRVKIADEGLKELDAYLKEEPQPRLSSSISEKFTRLADPDFDGPRVDKHFAQLKKLLPARLPVA